MHRVLLVAVALQQWREHLHYLKGSSGAVLLLALCIAAQSMVQAGKQPLMHTLFLLSPDGTACEILCSCSGLQCIDHCLLHICLRALGA